MDRRQLGSTQLTEHDRRGAVMRERILTTAGRLFYGRSILATGVDTIAAEVGISKRTLYNHFPSKDALVLASLGERFDLDEAPDTPPLEMILNDFDRIERAMARGNFRGCPFVNAVSENGKDVAVRDVARRSRRSGASG